MCSHVTGDQAQPRNACCCSAPAQRRRALDTLMALTTPAASYTTVRHSSMRSVASPPSQVRTCRFLSEQGVGLGPAPTSKHGRVPGRAGCHGAAPPSHAARARHRHATRAPAPYPGAAAARTGLKRKPSVLTLVRPAAPSDMSSRTCAAAAAPITGRSQAAPCGVAAQADMGVRGALPCIS